MFTVHITCSDHVTYEKKVAVFSDLVLLASRSIEQFTSFCSSNFGFEFIMNHLRSIFQGVWLTNSDQVIEILEHEGVSSSFLCFR